jgi:hypothetical protein
MVTDTLREEQPARRLGLRGGPWLCIMAAMRRLTALKICLVLVSALFMAPFQHLHMAGVPGGHQDSAIVHSHPYSFSFPIRQQTGTRVGDAHVATALNTFTFVPGVPLSLPFQVESANILPLFQAGTYCTLEIGQPRGHDPPWLDLSNPRAPPA